jgi:hypothetical protein
MSRSLRKPASIHRLRASSTSSLRAAASISIASSSRADCRQTLSASSSANRQFRNSYGSGNCPIVAPRQDPRLHGGPTYRNDGKHRCHGSPCVGMTETFCHHHVNRYFDGELDSAIPVFAEIQYVGMAGSLVIPAKAGILKRIYFDGILR